MVIVVRFVSNEWELQQRLLQFHILSKSMTGGEIARELITALSTKFGISSDLLLACMRDRASVNNVAVRFLTMMYPSLIDVPCLCSNNYLTVQKSKLKQDGSLSTIELQHHGKFNVVHQTLRLLIMECRRQQGKGPFWCSWWRLHYKNFFCSSCPVR